MIKEKKKNPYTFVEQTNHDGAKDSTFAINDDSVCKNSQSSNGDNFPIDITDPQGNTHHIITHIEDTPYFMDIDRKTGEKKLDPSKVPLYTALVRPSRQKEDDFPPSDIFACQYFDGNEKPSVNRLLYRYPDKGWKKQRTEDKFYNTIENLIRSTLPRGRASLYNKFNQYP